MSSASSFVCLPSDGEHEISHSQFSDFSFLETDDEPQFSSAPKRIANEPISDFEHIDVTTVEETAESNEWSAISDHNFDVESIATIASIHSIDSVHQFVFPHYEFNKTIASKRRQSKWIWISTKSRRSQRRNRNRNKNALCVIDENGGMQSEDEPFKRVLNVANLNEFIHDTIMINTHIDSIIRLCNKVAKYGILVVDDIEIELQQVPLIGLKLRDIFFRKLVLLNDGIQQKHRLRREYWLKLNWSSRMYLTPFASFDEFRDLYDVHKTVKSNEILAVIDSESFDILKKPEWIRVCLFRSYIARIQYFKHAQREDTERQIEEITSLLHIGCFNDEVLNMRRFKDEQMSIIMSDTFSRAESSHFMQSFDALEGEIVKQMRLQNNLSESCTHATYQS